MPIDEKWGLVRFGYIGGVYALSSIMKSMANPVLDAYTLEYLCKHSGNTSGTSDEDKGKASDDGKKRYGKERLWGAVSWAIVSVVMGVFLDMFGFSMIYVFNVGTALFMLALYAWHGFAEAIPGMKGDGTYEEVAGVDLESDEDVLLSKGNGNDERTDETFTPEGSKHEEEQEASEDSNTGNPSAKNVSAAGVMQYYTALLCNARAAIFLFTVLCAAVGTSLVENLIFLFFEQDLKASNFLCGVAVVITVSSRFTSLITL